MKAPPTHPQTCAKNPQTTNTRTSVRAAEPYDRVTSRVELGRMPPACRGCRCSNITSAHMFGKPDRNAPRAEKCDISRRPASGAGLAPFRSNTNTLTGCTCSGSDQKTGLHHPFWSLCWNAHWLHHEWWLLRSRKSLKPNITSQKGEHMCPDPCWQLKCQLATNCSASKREKVVWWCFDGWASAACSRHFALMPLPWMTSVFRAPTGLGHFSLPDLLVC